MATEKRAVRIGDPAPDFSLQSLEGRDVRLSDSRGKRVLLFLWASWSTSRDQLQSWQAFCQKHQGEGFELISVAMDAQGPEVVRPFVRRANVTFTTVVDSASALWDLYGFDLIPNGYFIDERGQVRYLRVGGFDVQDTTTLKIVEDLLSDRWSKKPVKVSLKPKLPVKKEIAELTRQVKGFSRGVEKRFRLAELMIETGQYKKAGKEYDIILGEHPKSIKALFGRGVVYHREKEPAKTLACWHRALALHPNNWVIRRQIWALEHPEHFYPVINHDWQKEQIRKEEREALTGIKAKAQRR